MRGAIPDTARLELREMTGQDIVWRDPAHW